MDYPIARHLKNHSSDEALLRAEGTEHITPITGGGDRLKRLIQRETFWIFRLDAMTFQGPNEEMNFEPFL